MKAPGAGWTWPMRTDQLMRLLWAAALVTLPVSSFRYFPIFGESTLVRPLAVYPVALLFALLLLQWLRGTIRFPWAGSTILLFVFALAVLAATGAGAVFAPIPMRGQTYFGRALRAWASLSIGMLFFLSAAAMNRTQADAKFTCRWILVGFGLTLAWSALQAMTFYTGLLDKETVTHWQLAFSMRELVRTNRISGLAYEPAWLAGQIATLYAPILFAAILTGLRLTSARWLEPALLALAFALVLATYSRGGILIALGAAALTLVLAGGGALRAGWSWFLYGLRRSGRGALSRIGLVVLIVAVVIGTFAFLSQKNYFRRLWEISAGSFGEYIIDVNAGARTAYAVGALASFHQHPLTGAGLGASGFHIYQNLPDWSLTTVTEIARQLNPANLLYPNAKNMYVRLLAEAGLAGLIFFIVFQGSVLADSLTGLRRAGWQRFLGIAGLFAWLAISLYNITQDSLTTPNLWLIPGMLAGLSLEFQQAPA